jgi:hypothetical protein
LFLLLLYSYPEDTIDIGLTERNRVAGCKQHRNAFISGLFTLILFEIKPAEFEKAAYLTEIISTVS